MFVQKGSSERCTSEKLIKNAPSDVPVGGDNSKAVAVRIDRPNKLEH
jgi:hypothetical protein